MKLEQSDKASKSRWGQILTMEENLRVLQYEDRLRMIDLHLQEDKEALNSNYQKQLKSAYQENKEPRIILIALFFLIDLGIVFGYLFIVY